MPIQNISVNDLENRKKEDETIILIDCREQAEWDESHVEGFTLIPLSCFEQSLEVLKDKSKDIHIMCRSGKRSMNACMFLEENGFDSLYNVQGGILAWKDAGLETK
jgi:rhodanese-related sulfurtransferase